MYTCASPHVLARSYILRGCYIRTSSCMCSAERWAQGAARFWKLVAMRRSRCLFKPLDIAEMPSAELCIRDRPMLA